MIHGTVVNNDYHLARTPRCTPSFKQTIRRLAPARAMVRWREATSGEGKAIINNDNDVLDVSTDYD